MTPLALIDANNFFVSCERLFRPDLAARPVIVLSSNDGCVISRSEEAKALGFAMGEPYFQVRDRCRTHDVAVFSSNFALYRDLSRRVMSMLRRYTDEVEVYSVDEAFLALDPRGGAFEEQARLIRGAVLREVGIPVSIGVARTKTLAKVATRFAKPKHGGSGIHALLELYERTVALEALPVREVWGIGVRLAPMLERCGVTTAGVLMRMDDAWLRKHMSIRGLRTVYELRGVRCFEVGEGSELRKSLLHSRSFGHPVYKRSELRASVAYHARKVAEVLRAESAQAREVYVQIRTSGHIECRYSAFDGDVLPLHTHDTLTITRTALAVLERIYRPGFPYAKAGVLVRDIIPDDVMPIRTLFAEESDPRRPLMEELDVLRHRFGDVVRVGVEGVAKEWHARHTRLSPAYTSMWSDIPVAGCRY